MTHWFRWFAIGIVGTALFAAPMDERKKTAGDPGKLAEMAKSAKTADDHRELARIYREQAAEFESKAKKHEGKADELAGRAGYNPLKHKWPAMVQGPIDRERNLAMQARRAAKESILLAERHEEMARKLAAA